MPGINFLAVVVASIVAFMASAVWYIVFGNEMVRLQDKKPDANDAAQQMPAWKVLVELARSFVVACVLASLFVQLGVSDWIDAVNHGLWLWVAFPVVLLVGSAIHENVPWRLAAIHAGDWLVKLILISVIVGVWR